MGHHGPDLPAEGDRDGLAHRGVVDGVELLAGKPLSGNSGIDKQASNKTNKQITVGGAVSVSFDSFFPFSFVNPL